MIKKIVVVSAFADEFCDREDRNIAKEFAKTCESTVLHIDELQVQDLNPETAYAFRCIYGPSGTVERDLTDVYMALNTQRISYINSSNGKGDQRGKGYLLELYANNFPVVPTFDQFDAARNFDSEEFIVKPLVGGSSIGQFSVPKSELGNTSFATPSIIQPKLQIKYETSYLYIDNQFQYALRTRNDRWDLVVYEPTLDELIFGERFVSWNPIRGVQRVDCIWTKDGRQFLIELEDWCPFLSLNDSADTPKDMFIHNLLLSLKIK